MTISAEPWIPSCPRRRAALLLGAVQLQQADVRSCCHPTMQQAIGRSMPAQGHAWQRLAWPRCLCAWVPGAACPLCRRRSRRLPRPQNRHPTRRPRPPGCRRDWTRGLPSHPALSAAVDTFTHTHTHTQQAALAGPACLPRLATVSQLPVCLSAIPGRSIGRSAQLRQPVSQQCSGLNASTV